MQIFGPLVLPSRGGYTSADFWSFGYTYMGKGLHKCICLELWLYLHGEGTHKVQILKPLAVPTWGRDWTGADFWTSGGTYMVLVGVDFKTE